MRARVLSFALIAGGSLGIATGGFLGTAHAEERSREGASIQFEYVVPIDCPSAETFVTQIRERAPSLREAAAAADAHVNVSVLRREDEGDQGGFEGHLVFADVSGARSERRVQGSSCADVVRALAFVVAVYAVEAAQAREEREERVTAPAPPPEPAPRIAPPLATDPDRKEMPPRVAGRALLASFGLRNAIGREADPEVAIAFELFDHGSTLSPSIRGRFAFAWATYVAGGDRLNARLFAGAVDGCAFRLRTSGGEFGVSPCLRFEIGFVQADAGPSAGGGPWMAPVALARARVRLAFDFFAELEAGAAVPFTLNRFYALDSGTPRIESGRAVLAQTPELAPVVAIALGRAFW